MVRCIMVLTLSSILFIAMFVVFSISRRTVMLDTASGIKTVLIHVSIKCMMVIADWRPRR